MQLIRVDINCQRNRNTARLTLVLAPDVGGCICSVIHGKVRAKCLFWGDLSGSRQPKYMHFGKSDAVIRPAVGAQSLA